MLPQPKYKSEFGKTGSDVSWLDIQYNAVSESGKVGSDINWLPSQLKKTSEFGSSGKTEILLPEQPNVDKLSKYCIPSTLLTWASMTNKYFAVKTWEHVVSNIVSVTSKQPPKPWLMSAALKLESGISTYWACE